MQWPSCFVSCFVSGAGAALLDRVGGCVTKEQGWPPLVAPLPIPLCIINFTLVARGMDRLA